MTTETKYANTHKFIARLFDTTGGYTPTLRNGPAIAFIQKGAGLGNKVWDKLPDALKATAAHAKKLLESRADDSGYKTILTLADILLPAATKQLYYAIRDESRKDELRVRVQGYSFNAVTGKEEVAIDINADAWAEQTTVDLGGEAEENAGNDMGFEKRGMEDKPEDETAVRFTSDELRQYIDELSTLLIGFVLPADKIVNGWRMDYADRSALAFLIAPKADGTYVRAENIDQALAMMDMMADERELRTKQSNRSLVAAAATVWG
jgi:hypothetical protein